MNYHLTNNHNEALIGRNEDIVFIGGGKQLKFYDFKILLLHTGFLNSKNHQTILEVIKTKPIFFIVQKNFLHQLPYNKGFKFTSAILSHQ